MKTKLTARTILLALVILFVPSVGSAVDDATVQAIDSKASTANSKADGNNSRIQALEAEDVVLHDLISNIQLTPGPKGDKGDPGPQGPAGADGAQGPEGPLGANLERPDVGSFYTEIEGATNPLTITTLAADTGFVITDILARVYHSTTILTNVSTRFSIMSGGETLLYAGLEPTGPVESGDAKQTQFTFENGIAIPPGGDISINTFLSDGEHNITIMGYYFKSMSDAGSFYTKINAATEPQTITTLAADTGFVITDIFARVYHSPVVTLDVTARVGVMSGGETLFHGGLMPNGPVESGRSKQTQFSFENGIVIPPGGDISINTFRSHGEHDITIMGYYFK